MKYAFTVNNTVTQVEADSYADAIVQANNILGEHTWEFQGFDTSGSISDDLLEKFHEEVKEIMKLVDNQ